MEWSGRSPGVGWIGSSTHLTDHKTGTALKTSTFAVTGTGAAHPDGSDGIITLKTGGTTWAVGDRFTIGSVYAVHPETKQSYGYLKQLVVTKALSGAGDLYFSAGIGGAAGLSASGARQNVDALPQADAVVTKLAADASEYTNRSLYFHRDFYAVAFADLENPKKYGAWGDTQVVDGVSVRVWRQGDIVNGKFPGRLDVLVGYKAIRPELACVLHADG